MMEEQTAAFRRLVFAKGSAGAPDAAAPEVVPLCSLDQTSAAIATSRALFWRGRLDAGALERALEATLADVPLLSGRLAPLNLPAGWRLADVRVELSNAGAELAVVDAPDVELADVGPNAWVMRDVTIAGPRIPFYLPTMDVGAALLAGREPLAKAKLSRLADGDVLGLTLSHVVTDGAHWPALLRHLAARYREAAGGAPPAPGELLAPDCGKAGLSSAALREPLLGAAAAAAWAPEPFVIAPSLGDYLRAARLL
jgi:hypothetical protein